MPILDFLWSLWGAVSYVLAVFIAVYMVGCKMPHNKHFVVKIIICSLLIFAFTFGLEHIVGLFTDIDPMFRMFLRTTNSFFVYLLTAVGVKICFNCDIWAAVFCSTAGYTMQHLSNRLYLIYTTLTTDIPKYVNMIVLIAITVAVYLTMYFLTLRNKKHDNIMVDNKVQVIVAASVVLLMIYINSFAGRETSSNLGRVLNYIFSAITCILVLFVEFGQLKQKKAESERDVFKQMLYHEREQYHIEKAIIDVINMKSHDLKHQVTALEGKVDAEELERISAAVNVYDSIFKTGNTALDIVLNRKSLLCENKDIKLTCMADGAKLSFISDVDIYSLFGNILDNAIEAAEQFDDKDKRIISLTIVAKNSFLFVRSENYVVAPPTIIDGLPQTTKSNKDYHGFGMKSIDFLSQKYGGDCNVKTKGNMFILDIMLPIKNK